MDDELTFHRERTIGEFVARGMSRVEAEREATRRFGPHARYRTRLVRLEMRRYTREKRRATMQIMTQSVRAIARGAVRAPGFTLGVIAILTLGLGVNAITFALVDRLILRGPAEVVAPESLYRVVAHRHSASGASIARTEFSYADYQVLLASPQVAGAGAESATPLLFGSGDTAERIQGRLVTANYFSLLGVTPARGRFFTADESEREGARLAVLSHAFWTSRFGGDPALIGQTLYIESNRYTIIGIAPRRFTGSAVSKVDVFLPLEAAADEQISGTWRSGFSIGWVAPLVRLAPDTAPEAVESALTAGYREARRGTRDEDPAARLALEPLNAVRGETARGDAGVAALLWAVALLVLAIAAANVANLFLARALRNAEQLGVRLALGASRARLLAEQACEGALLALVGAIAAVMVALVGAPVVQRLLFPDVDWLETSVDVRGLIFVAGCAVVGGASAAALPVWRAGRLDLLSGLRTGQRTARGSSRTQSAMLVVQGALSVLLLVGAGLFVKSLDRVQTVDLGVVANRLMILSAARGDTPPRQDFRDEWRRRVSLIPGVEQTTHAAGTVPFVSSWAVRVNVPGLAERPTVDDGGPYISAVEPGYFETVGTRIVEGRSFSAADRQGAPPVVIVNRTMARLYWPGQQAIGQCIEIGTKPSGCAVVVGVAENTRRQAIIEGDSLLFFVPLEQSSPDLRSSPRLIARLSADDTDTASRVGETARRDALTIEPSLRIVTARPLEEVIAPQLRAWRLGAGLFSVFGLLALLVAAIGLYSVVAFNVEGRRREIGVRSALGASGAAILRLVVVDGLRLAAGGIVLGVAAAWLVSPRISNLLFDVTPHDTQVYVVVGLVLTAAALLASIIPAARAARINPSRALRSE